MQKTEDFIKKANNKHGHKYDYSKVEYGRNNNIEVIIICKKHGEFPQRPRIHLSGSGCKKCANNIPTTEEWIKKAKDKHGDKYDYSLTVYKSAKEYVIIICKEHKYEFTQTPDNHMNCTDGCDKCKHNYSPTTEEWIKRAKEKHGDKYDYSKVVYENCDEEVIIICDKHGEFRQTPNGHMHCVDGCNKCQDKYSPTTEEWIKRAKEKHGDKYDYSKVVYEKNDKEVIIICEKHGEFSQLPSNHVKGHGCRDCGYLETSKKLKFTKEEFTEKAKKIHGDKYDYSKVVYENCDENVIIICEKHGEFPQTPYHHVNDRNGCPTCAHITNGLLKRSNTQDFIEKAKKIHGDKYDYSKVVYEMSDKYVIIICKIDEHGEFPQTPNNHLNGQGCYDCGLIASGLLRRSNTEDFIEKAKKIHGDRYDYSKTVYEKSHENVIIICKDHGEFTQMPSNHLDRRNGCDKCKHNYSPTTEEWIKRAKEKHGDKYDYSKVVYENCDEEVIIICEKHGEFKQTPYNHVNRVYGCNTCSKKRSENLCRQILEEYTGLRFPSIRPDFLKNVTTACNLELDGFCEDLNLAFEYQGIQHYEYNAFFHRNDQESLKKQQQRDKLKLELCKKYGVDVLIIPHTLSYQNENELRIFIKEELQKIVDCDFLWTD
jgi:hypothetical protein